MLCWFGTWRHNRSRHDAIRSMPTMWNGPHCQLDTIIVRINIDTFGQMAYSDAKFPISKYISLIQVKFWTPSCQIFRIFGPIRNFGDGVMLLCPTVSHRMLSFIFHLKPLRNSFHIICFGNMVHVLNKHLSSHEWKPHERYLLYVCKQWKKFVCPHASELDGHKADNSRTEFT